MINIPVSVGELLDKLSILQVKKNNVTNKSKLDLINKEFELLHSLSLEYISNPIIRPLYDDLININSKLWKIEDDIRIFESSKTFNQEFIDLARSVYFTNDERFEVKNKINIELNSSIKEVKEYVNYK